MKTRDFLNAICDCRVCQRQDGQWLVWATTDDIASDVTRALFDSGRVTAGREGWQSLRQLGLVQHVYLLKLRRAIVRVLSPAIHPRGLFSPMPPESF